MRPLSTPDAVAGYRLSLSTPVILLPDALAMRMIDRNEQMREPPIADQAPAHAVRTTLRQGVIGFSLAAGVVVAAGLWLPIVGKALAWQNGLAERFVGTRFVAAVTSAPEAVVTIATVPLGALDLVLGNLFGSNLFDIVILAVSALTAMVMSGIAIIDLFYRAQGRVRRSVGWASLCLLAVYFFNGYALYLNAH